MTDNDDFIGTATYSPDDSESHAIGFLKSGGRLVALCANRRRQRGQLRPRTEVDFVIGTDSSPLDFLRNKPNERGTLTPGRITVKTSTGERIRLKLY